MNEAVEKSVSELLEKPVSELLQKFGRGSHKPGSGSAAALQGMLSAQLAKTVITLTLDDKRIENYQEYVLELKDMLEVIDEELLPQLEILFCKDSVQFHEVIDLRVRRNSAESIVEKSKFSLEAKEQLKLSIEIPVEIALLCIRLGDISSFIFKNGWSSVRGDSGVALSGAIAGVEGALAIIDLNFISLDADEWVQKTKDKVLGLRESLESLKGVRDSLFLNLQGEADRKNEFSIKLQEFASEINSMNSFENQRLEELVRKLHIILWNYRDVVFPGKLNVEPKDILSVKEVLKQLGYQYSVESSLGVQGVGADSFEVAGAISKTDKTVQISDQYPEDVRNFTAAHELGHALMHNQKTMHRDRPTDGAIFVRTKMEKEADKFASYFLMPGRLTRQIFIHLFDTDQLIIDDFVLHNLRMSPEEAEKRFVSLRDFSQYVVNLRSFGRKRFNESLSESFGVSREAMAIRLEELNLVSLG